MSERSDEEMRAMFRRREIVLSAAIAVFFGALVVLSLGSAWTFSATWYQRSRIEGVVLILGCVSLAAVSALPVWWEVSWWVWSAWRRWRRG